MVWEFWESTYWMETFHLAFEILPYSESELGMAISCLSGNLIADAWRNVKSSLVKKRRRCEVKCLTYWLAAACLQGKEEGVGSINYGSGHKHLLCSIILVLMLYAQVLLTQ